MVSVPEQKRRLATILAADVVGYSGLMAENEEARRRYLGESFTLERYRS